ncbi:long-chain fatty acid--CoA ligase [Leptospira perolatii]|uniref:Long-chain fatty acid--CoA ligase n=1 Tax=Leptospira perolatii TaxID=2023191 RepID=A0A2M9ZJW7_9LEPT|nr:AMP-binding protein [Leptospira perolatii]PJZ69449.1 long-chain fatty acid--CoA ligase [Leptospira perolatii]PJZ72274.1 long-chain fatty acid--CoA ligase [Leptospira perolatii]
MEKQSIYHLVRDSCIAFQERPLHWCWDEKQRTFTGISYGDWKESLAQLSAFLLQKGMKKGDKIGLVCDNRTEWSLCSFSIVCAGGVDVPRGCDASSEDLEYILEHTESRILFVEKDGVLSKLLKHSKALSRLETMVLIESEDSYPKLAEVKSKFPKLEILTLSEAISVGLAYFQKKGKEAVKSIGESLTGNDIATIIYTSGTTGSPKGVVLNHRAFTWTIEQLHQFVPISYEDRTVVFLPPWHIAERILETALLSWGASMACSGVTQLARDFGIIKPTVLVSVPRVWESLYRRIWDTAEKGPSWKFRIFQTAVRLAEFYSSVYDTLSGNYALTEDESSDEKFRDKLVAFAIYPLVFLANKLSLKILAPVRASLGGKIRFAFCGAGAMPPKIQFFFRSIGIPIIETYGMTETTGMGAMGSFPIPKTGAIGPVFPGAHIKLVDESGKVISQPGEKGILWHKGPHVTVGYYKDPDRNKVSLQEGWFDSGDLFVWTKSSELKFAGRVKDTIVLSSGENVEPEPIESKITETGWVQYAIVVGQDQKFLSVLIVPQFQKLRDHFASEGIKLEEEDDKLAQNPKVLQFYKDLVKSTISSKNGFKNFERISGVSLIEKEFEKGRELTETMKLKRNVVSELYASKIREMYS